MKRFIVVMSIICPMLLGTGILNAQASIHGFGGWGYGNTDGNHYLIGDDEGEFNHSQLALNMTARPFENFVINSQLSWTQSHDGLANALDYAFAEWAFSDELKLRIGKVKHPFGIYTEVYDVGTIRPFFTLPQGIYGATGITTKSFNGVGFSGSYYADNDWGVSYDVLFGGIILANSEPWSVLEEEEADTGHVEAEEHDEHSSEIHLVTNKNAVGTRISISTPIEGLNFGFSAYTLKPEHGHQEEGEEAKEQVFGDHKSYGVHIEFLQDKLWYRSEYAVHDHKDFINAQAAYIEIAYKLTENWQGAVRYDWMDSELAEVDISEAPSIVEHKDIAVGLNYWFNTNFVIRLEYHTIEGNRFAMPEDLHEAIEGGVLETKTSLILFGTHFSF